MKYKIINNKHKEKGIVMENKYSKEGNQQVKQKERLVNYDFY